MCREFARAVGELWRIIGDAFSPYRPELHYVSVLKLLESIELVVI